MTTMSEAAVNGIDVTISCGVVRVKDGEDMWLCEETAFAVAIAKLGTKEAVEGEDGEAYSALCAAVRSPVASINGSSRGHWRPLVESAYAFELIDADDVRAYGVEI